MAEVAPSSPLLPVSELPLRAFLGYLSARGLSLDLDAEGRFLLSGPKEARTPEIRAYLRENGAPLVVLLRADGTALSQPARPIPRSLTASEIAGFRALWEASEREGKGPIALKAAEEGYLPFPSSDHTSESYCQMIQDAYQAALADEMPPCGLKLCSGVTIGGAARSLLVYVREARALRYRLGAKWHLRSEGVPVAEAIERIAQWYKDQTSAGVSAPDTG